MPGEAQSEEEYEPHSNIRLGSRIPVPLPTPLHPAVAASLSRGRMPSLMVLAKVWPTPRSMLVTQGSGQSHDVRLHVVGVSCLALVHVVRLANREYRDAGATEDLAQLGLLMLVRYRLFNAALLVVCVATIFKP